MATVKVPNHVLDEDHIIYYGIADTKTIPAGSFVKPIDTVYLPKHVLENPQWKFFNKDKEVFCYTYYGIVPIAKSKIREV